MKKITCGIALIAALTLLGAPLAAHATEETEVASSESTEAVTATTTLTTPTTEVLTPLTPTVISSPPTPTAEKVTPESVSPAETPQPTVSEDTSTTPITTTTPTPTTSVSTPPTISPKYILAVWRNPAGSPKFPQYLVASYETDSTNVKVLDTYAQLCGTFYQSDLYANDERTKALIANGVLNGGMESWPDNGTQRYDTLTTEPCLPTPPVTPPVIIPPTDEPEEETPSPSTPPTPAGPTTPDAPGTGSTGGGTAPLPTSTEDTPLTAPSAAPSLHTALKATGTTTDLVGDQPATSSLAYTGANEVNNIGAGIALLAILAGLLIVVLSRNRRP